jgi:hypothetical protein
MSPPIHTHASDQDSNTPVVRLDERRFAVALAMLLFLGCGGSVEQGGSTNSSSLGGTSNSAGGSSANVGGMPAAGGLGYAGATGAGVDCSTVACNLVGCPPNSTLVTLVGQCCPSCQAIDSSCASVSCLSVNCPSGFVPRREPGACCDTCAALPGAGYPTCGGTCGPVSLPTTCPIGYHYTYPDWSCCGTCEPDPNYCESANDCMLATKDSGCCSCSTSISNRLYADDPCYSSPNAPRPVPAYCTPQYHCDMACAPCGSGLIPSCSNNVCGVAVLLN